MNIFRLLVSALLLGGLAGACGGTTSGAGSNSNWLGTCATNADCKGALECRCGVCTASCETAGDCAKLANGAACVPTSALGTTCATETTKSCTAGCAADTDCAALGTSARCSAGECHVVPPLADGGTKEGGAYVCDGVPDQASNLVLPIVEKADKSCVLDSDCVASPSVTCGDPCGIPFISKKGAAAIASDLATIEHQVCDPYHAAHCPKPFYGCPAIGFPKCTSGVCANYLGGASDAGSPSCGTQTQAMAMRLQSKEANADRACKLDTDCVTVWLDNGCYHACASAAVSQSGGNALSAELASMETELCPAFDAAGCKAFALPCPAPFPAHCASGRCTSDPSGASDAGSPSCTAQTDAMHQRLQAKEASTDKRCTVDTDCTTVILTTRCYHECKSAGVSQAGATTLKAELASMETELCPAFDAAGCTSALPPCAAPPTSTCVGGLCTGTRL